MSDLKFVPTVAMANCACVETTGNAVIPPEADGPDSRTLPDGGRTDERNLRFWLEIDRWNRPRDTDRTSEGRAGRSQERVRLPLPADRRLRTVAGKDSGLVVQDEQPFQRSPHGLGIRGRKIDPADRSREERVPGEERPGRLVQEAGRAGTVTGQMQDSC